jgi:LytS/YehU family sensor histidine kinase
VTDDPREARRLLANLGDLLRDAVSRPSETQTLEQEIYWLQRYAAILEARHAGALQFRWDVADEARGILLPRLLLQPLVENAVRHGALQRRDGGEVIVRARITRSGSSSDARVVCSIEDNGPGVGAPREGAFGLHSVRRRLELLCPEGSLRLESTDHGTRSVVELPVHRLPEGAPAPVSC